MLRSICVKMSILCVAFGALATSASAQTGPNTYNPTTPAYGTNSYTNEVLEAEFRKIDPNLKVTHNANGATIYTFTVHRVEGLDLITSVVVQGSKMLLMAGVTDVFDTQLSEQELDGHLIEVNKKMATMHVKAYKENGKAMIFLVREMDRTTADEVFLQQITAFFNAAAGMKAEASSIK